MAEAVRIAVAVVESNGQFLVGQRPAGVALAGKYEFPGGKVEAGETAAAAAVRECREETGLEVVVTGQYPTHVEDYPHGTVELHFFACLPASQATGPVAEKPPAQGSHSPAFNPEPGPPFRWVTRKELVQLDFPRGNKQLLALLVDETG